MADTETLIGVATGWVAQHFRHGIGTSGSHAPGYCDATNASSRRRSIDVRARNAAVAEDLDDQSGQGMVEYALILVLIAIVVIVILTVVGSQVNNVFSNISSGLGS